MMRHKSGLCSPCLDRKSHFEFLFTKLLYAKKLNEFMKLPYTCMCLGDFYQHSRLVCLLVYDRMTRAKTV
jgi:hypothetical protein